MEEQTKEHKESGRNPKEIIKSYRKQKLQTEQMLSFYERDLELRKLMLEFEKNNCEILNGKPKYMSDPKYMDLVIEQKQLQFEVQEVELKNRISQAQTAISGISKEITRLERNGEVKKDE